MDANEFLHKKDVAYMNRLSTSLDFDSTVSLMEEYAALRHAHVIGAVCDSCGSKFDAMDIAFGVCYYCQKEIK